MNTIHEYISTMSRSERIDIVESFEQFERDGFTAMDSVIRTATSKFLFDSGIEGEHSGPISFWMNLMGFECYRKIAIDCLRDEEIGI